MAESHRDHLTVRAISQKISKHASLKDFFKPKVEVFAKAPEATRAPAESAGLCCSAAPGADAQRPFECQRVEGCDPRDV